MIRNVPDDTEFFHFHNANPKGIRASDCVMRAVAVGLGQTWDESLRELTQTAMTIKRSPNETPTLIAYLKSKGWVKKAQPRTTHGKKLTGIQFIQQMPMEYRDKPIICKIGTHHVSVVKNGKFWDTWDPTSYTVGNYWIKEE